ncbi:MAG TPA: MBL fold metallo-hydrolase [Thermoplasmata archaeon]|nr:MBL fold metallo-hydrolase [Thermoplasmata archaeon]
MAAGTSPLPHPFFRPPRAGAAPLVAPCELRRLLEGPSPPYLLDVRPAAERAIAHLSGDRSVPLEALPAALASLPRDRAIVAYDQFGARARQATEFLQARGFPLAVALEGGLDEYARVADPAIARYDLDAGGLDLVVRQIPRPDSGCLAYLLADPVERAAVIVDPGREVGPYLELLHEEDWQLRAILETHTHADHLAGHAALHAATSAPIYVSHRSPAEYPHHALSEDAALAFGREEIRVLETPGHTRDHLTLGVRDKIFTGDTLLLGSCGRTDLGDGSADRLWESLTDKLLRLPAETEVYPAHYGPRHALSERYVSTLGFERAVNEALAQPTREAFVAYMTEGWPPKPADFDRIVRTNLAE